MTRKIIHSRVAMANVYLPAELAAQVNLLLLDPKSRKMRWGAWQTLVVRLVRDWVEKQKIDPSEAEALRASEHRNMQKTMEQFDE